LNNDKSIDIKKLMQDLFDEGVTIEAIQGFYHDQIEREKAERERARQRIIIENRNILIASLCDYIEALFEKDISEKEEAMIRATIEDMEKDLLSLKTQKEKIEDAGSSNKNTNSEDLAKLMHLFSWLNH
jgi:hypothetical protein